MLQQLLQQCCNASAMAPWHCCTNVATLLQQCCNMPWHCCNTSAMAPWHNSHFSLKMRNNFLIFN